MATNIKYHHTFTRYNISRGGFTIAYTEPDGEGYISVGFAICRRGENFSKKIGREHAHKRLVSTPIKIQKPEVPYEIYENLVETYVDGHQGSARYWNEEFVTLHNKMYKGKKEPEKEPEKFELFDVRVMLHGKAYMVKVPARDFIDVQNTLDQLWDNGEVVGKLQG